MRLQRRCISCLAGLSLAGLSNAQTPGSIVQVGNTLVSAMMMFLGNDEKVYMIDKVEGNAAQIDGHPAWASVWDIGSKTASPMPGTSNPFCASGMHLPNGSFATFGGNSQIGPGGSDQAGPYDNIDGRKAIRVLNPCTGSDANFSQPRCNWYDDANVLAMNAQRWYAAAEPLGDGTVAIIGGYTGGGYVNRNFPNNNPDAGSENTYEFYPDNGRGKTIMNFMRQTSGLNSYAHTFLMPSGKMFVQANLSTMLWEPATNVEHPLPPMPNGVARVYPASGAVAMLPLTPQNNYTPTIIFCGGSDMSSDSYGNFANPAINTWNYPASQDCQRITPEPQDGSAPVYTADDNLIQGRTMGQFIILPTGQMMIFNGALNGTAGYSNTGTGISINGVEFNPPGGQTRNPANMPYGQSLAAGPTMQPVMYDPTAPSGSRFSSAGFQTSTVPRMYHSSAILLPDGSVLIAGGNPNIDVNLTAPFPTTYTAEYFYPPYFAAKVRPTPQGLPGVLSYGGPSFDVTIPANNYAGSGNAAAANTTVVLIRPGFTTHAMNMGQRMLVLNNTYTVNADGSYVLHVSQVPNNPNILTPGPVLIYVVVNGIPSVGTTIIVGNGRFGNQPTNDMAGLPAIITKDAAFGTVDGGPTGSSTGSSASTSSTGSPSSNTSSGSGSTTNTGLIGGVVGGVVGLAILAALGIFFARRRRNNMSRDPVVSMPMAMAGSGPAYGAGRMSRGSSFAPLYPNNRSTGAFTHENTASAYGGSPMMNPGTPRGYSYNPVEDEFDPYEQRRA